ncbi:MAG: hypothetical protein EPO24_00880 [Bacteroidetes bacterium]|nr:MAG: hypothetical protein EPO24_00880 [Bacteroidota bacterium]
MKADNMAIKKNGYSYYVSDEQVREFQKLSVEERFRWLEEAQEFLFKTLPPEQWEIMQKFRRGEI